MGAAAAKGVCGVQGWGWEGRGRVVGALFVEGASAFVSKEAFRECGKGSFREPARSFRQRPSEAAVSEKCPVSII